MKSPDALLCCATVCVPCLIAKNLSSTGFSLPLGGIFYISRIKGITAASFDD